MRILDRSDNLRNSTAIMTRGQPSRICDVLVVGAGPGGLVAGITLARYGIDVLVIDKRPGPSGL